MTLKWAESADGKVAGPGGARMQISGPESSQLVHQLRARSDGIVIGIGTALTDDPMLTPRDVPVRRKPMRVILDRKLRLPLTSRLAQSAREWPTAVIYNQLHLVHSMKSLLALGVALHGHDAQGTDDDIDLGLSIDIMREKLGLNEILVEAGPTLARRFFTFAGAYINCEAGRPSLVVPFQLVHRLWVFRSPTLIGDPTAPAAPSIPDWLVPTGTLHVGADTLTEYRAPTILKNPTDEHCFVTWPVVPSADFVLAGER